MSAKSDLFFWPDIHDLPFTEEAQAALDKLTPEERRQAEIDGKKLMEEDMAAKQKILDEAAKFVAEHSEKKREAPKFCTNCGARIRGGKFCENCGSPLDDIRK